MATGATDDYWREQALPGVYKHALLKRYIPVFGGKTGSRSGRVVFLDGYAGRGRHTDGTPGSAELILKTAEHQAGSRISWTCYFFEKDPTSYAELQKVVDEYAVRGVDATAENAPVEEGMATVLAAADGLPLFMFLDPCGLGLPYEDLVTALNDPGRRHFPTEVLLNFSMDAVRRIGGLINSPHRNEKTISRLDSAVGGQWWRDHFTSGDPDPDAVIEGFVERLARDTNAKVGAFPVRRAPHHKPVYYLVFATRSYDGVWGISDAAAKAADDWRDKYAEALKDPDALFDLRPAITRNSLEAAALPDVVANLTRLLAEREEFTVVDHPEIIKGHFGEIGNLVVRTAIKQLHQEGKTNCTGVGELLRLEVTRPGP